MDGRVIMGIMFKEQDWFEYLEPTMRDLVEEAYYLLDREEMGGDELVDYSFIVFPMAKAYEGFVKKFLHDIGLISEKTYLSKHFRIGRSLNPSLPAKYRNGWWLFDDLQRMCEGIDDAEYKKFPRLMWKAWREGRNKIFHYFAGRERLVSLEEARKLVDGLREVMEMSVKCRVLIKSVED